MKVNLYRNNNAKVAILNAIGNNVELTKQNGGCSINRKLEQPKTGYMVGIKGFDSDLVGMINTPLDVNEYYGSWTNYTGITEFDISLNVMDLDEAIKLGKEHNQLAIYDLINDESIQIVKE